MRKKHLKQPIMTSDCQLMHTNRSGDPSTGVWADLMPGGNNGIANDPAILTNYEFDGVSDKVESTTLSAPSSFAGPWTLCWWAKRDPSVTGRVTMIQTRKNTVPYGGWMIRDLNFTTVQPFSIETGDPYVLYASMFPSGADGEWHFYCVSWKPGPPHAFMTFYDGSPWASAAPASLPADGNPLMIGKGTYYAFKGNIDNVRAYARVLSNDEIERDFFAGRFA